MRNHIVFLPCLFYPVSCEDNKWFGWNDVISLSMANCTALAMIIMLFSIQPTNIGNFSFFIEMIMIIGSCPALKESKHEYEKILFPKMSLFTFFQWSILE